MKCVPTELFTHTGYAYIVCDVKRKADELTRYFIAAKEDGAEADQMNESINMKAKFIF